MSREEREAAINYFENMKKGIFPFNGNWLFDMVIEALKAESCEDAISRQAVLEPYKYLKDDDVISIWLIKKNIEQQKSVIPTRPTGHWKAVPNNSKRGEYRPNKYACSECGWEIDLCRGLQQDTGHRLFCEHCGAKMKNKEGEDK